MSELEKAVKEKIVIEAATTVLSKMSDEELRPIFVKGIMDAIDKMVDSYQIRRTISDAIAEKATILLQEPFFQQAMEEQARKLAQEYIDKCYGPASKRLEWVAKEKVFSDE